MKRRSLAASEILNVVAVLGIVGLMAVHVGRGRMLPEEPRAAPAVNGAVYPRPPIAETFSGQVAHISDGDTIYVATTPGGCGAAGHSRRSGGTSCRTVRLQGIDAPESDQPCTLPDGQTTWCGTTARATLVRLIGDQDVICETPADDPVDRYGRALAFCRTAGGVDMNLEMVRQGQAVAYRQYLKSRPHAGAYIAAEAEAYREHRGIWASKFDLPSDWRKSRRAGG